MIAPRLVAGGEQSVLADPTPFDLLDQPSGRESNRPAGGGLDLLARLGPVEDRLPMNLMWALTPRPRWTRWILTSSPNRSIREPIWSMSEAPGRRMHVYDRSMGACRVEDLIQLSGTRRVIGLPAEQEVRLEDLHALLADVDEGTCVELCVLGPVDTRHPQLPSVVGRGGLQRRWLKENDKEASGPPVVRHDEGSLGALGIEVGKEVLDRPVSRAIGLTRGPP
jgi:hypothetical protein